MFDALKTIGGFWFAMVLTYGLIALVLIALGFFRRRIVHMSRGRAKG